MIIEYFSIIYDRKKPQKAILEASRESKTYNEYRTLNDESAIVKLLFFFIHGNLKELYIISNFRYILNVKRISSPFKNPD